MIKELLKHAKGSLKYTLITPCLVALEVVIDVMIPYITPSTIAIAAKTNNIPLAMPT